jgi:hypothetical protein
MGNFLSSILGGVTGAATGLLAGGPVGAAAGAVNGLENLALQAEELRHQTDMQIQAQQFNDVQDEKAEQMREMNSLRDVAMKQHEADDKIVKEFIRTAGSE